MTKKQQDLVRLGDALDAAEKANGGLHAVLSVMFAVRDIIADDLSEARAQLKRETEAKAAAEKAAAEKAEAERAKAQETAEREEREAADALLARIKPALDKDRENSHVSKS